MNKYHATFLNKISHYAWKYKTNDPSLRGLIYIFRDNYSIQWLMEHLLRRVGCGGNLTHISLKNNRAIITCLLFEDDYELEIPLDKFMKFLHDWHEATKDDPEEITLTRDDEWNIDIMTKP